MLCPECKSELEELDMYDVELGDDWHVKYIVGECPICKKEFQWERNYKFYNEDNLKEC